MRVRHVLLLLVLSTGPATLPAAGSAAGTPAERPPDRSLLWRSEEALRRVAPPTGPAAVPRSGASYGYDVDHVDLAVDLTASVPPLSGVSTLTVTIDAAPLAELALDLHGALTVDGVRVDGAAVPFVHATDQVLVTPAAPFPAGTTHDVEVTYHGTPVPVQHKGMQFTDHGGTRIVYTLSTPFSEPGLTVIPISSRWRPCKDVPDDKSTVTLAITVPDGELACANGVMTSNVDHGDGTRTVTWDHGFPVAPYLVGLATSNFVTVEDTYTGDGGSALVQHFVYPELAANAAVSFDVVVPAMGQLADVFGEYPFVGEKYGMFVSPSPAAVESQTMVAYIDWLVNGSHTYDWVVVHELAHQWWGDHVGAASWQHVWLNEGFASYAEALWREANAGAVAYRAYMEGMDNGPWSGTLFDPPSVWDSIVYNKGAWVLHMLRWVLGDAGFFQCLADYRAAYGGGDATTDDFAAIAGSVYGADLGWFFDQWVYAEGRPSYEVGWSSSGTGPYTVHIGLRQTQSDALPTFRMPVRIGVVTTLGIDGFTVTDSLRAQGFDLEVGGEPLDVVVDPQDWILGDFVPAPTSTVVTAPQGARLWQSEPNPFTAGTTIRFELSRAMPVSLRLFDVRGRLVRTLVTGPLDAGTHRVEWNGRNGDGRPVAGGVYFYRLEGEGGALQRTVTRLR